MGYKKGETLRTPFEVYIIERQVGAGGSGEVYEVRDAENRVFAAKILDMARVNSSRLKRFKNEINFCSKNTHRNIIQTIGSGVSDKGATFFVMPLYSGTLRNLVLKGIPPQDVLPLFVQVLDGVEAAHLKGVWHRDIKPENVLHSATSNLLAVADFGIAHFEEEELLTAVETKNNERLASFQYSAPEQRTRGQVVGDRADIYALGLILNEMFTGAVPQGTGFRRVIDASPDHGYLDGVIDLMLRQDPSQRPSVSDVKRELIARGNEFISIQRLNALQSEVIPETEVDDPFIRNPVRVMNVDYEGGDLVFNLSTAPPPNWIRQFQSPQGSFNYYQSAGPGHFRFYANNARVGLSQGVDAQTLVSYTKDYVDRANRQYAATLEAENRARIEEERKRLRERIEEESRRQKILSEIKI